MFMKHKLKITHKAKKDLESLDKKSQIRIVTKLRFFITQDKPLEYAKKLKDPKFGTYRFRIGDYRVIFDKDKNGNIIILIILRIKHRKDIYFI